MIPVTHPSLKQFERLLNAFVAASSAWAKHSIGGKEYESAREALFEHVRTLQGPATSNRIEVLEASVAQLQRDYASLDRQMESRRNAEDRLLRAIHQLKKVAPPPAT